MKKAPAKVKRSMTAYGHYHNYKSVRSLNYTLVTCRKEQIHCGLASSLLKGLVNILSVVSCSCFSPINIFLLAALSVFQTAGLQRYHAGSVHKSRWSAPPPQPGAFLNRLISYFQAFKSFFIHEASLRTGVFPLTPISSVFSLLNISNSTDSMQDIFFMWVMFSM